MFFKLEPKELLFCNAEKQAFNTLMASLFQKAHKHSMVILSKQNLKKTDDWMRENGCM